MFIKKIVAQNFKSFKNIDIDLQKFNILIGANASGKSNFINIFEFLRSIVKSGLDNAISLQGGIEYLKNINLPQMDTLSLNIIFEPEFGILRQVKKELMGIKFIEADYSFSLKIKRGKVKYIIVNDTLIQKCDFMLMDHRKIKVKEKGKIGSGNIQITRSNGKAKINLVKPENIEIKIDDIFPPFIEMEKIPANNLIIENPFFLYPSLERGLEDISIYDFDPKIPKKATPITAKAELEEDGSNLSIVLKNIIEDREEKRKLFNLTKDLLPFIAEVDVEKFSDKSLLFKLREVYSKKQYLPASLISDGTINIMALIIALYFQRKNLTIIEEPERNIHPYLISKIVDIMKDASKNKQLIVTTHNPEIVKYGGLSNILLVLRDNEGFSEIYRPSDKEEILTFLKNEIGIEELYVQNLLGI